MSQAKVLSEAEIKRILAVGLVPIHHFRGLLDPFAGIWLFDLAVVVGTGITGENGDVPFSAFGFRLP